MGYWKRIVALVIFYLHVVFAGKPYSAAEEVQFEALKSGGFRAYIADHPELEKFKLDVKIENSTGEISGEVTTATNGFWVIDFKNKLKTGDSITYSVNIIAERLRYGKSGQVWKVAESDLRDTYSPLIACKPSSTTVNGEKACGGKLVLLDEFDGPSVNRSNWSVEHRILTYEGINAEFNSYEDTDDTRFLKDGILYIKPIARQNEDEVRGILNLRNRCTSTDDRQCYYEQHGAFLLPPVKSARLTSKIPFKYGKVEIKAKLPAGDWIVPVIELHPKDSNNANFSTKILIAYSRGNAHLRGTTGIDIGSHLLYAGPILSPGFLEENQMLKKRSSTDNKPYYSDFHIYTLEWLPGTMSFYIDSELYGTIDISQDMSAIDKESLLSLGVAVGGTDSFPDDYMSGNNRRPWDYSNRNYVKTFFDARNVWSKTWTGDNCALRVEYVKVWAT